MTKKDFFRVLIKIFTLYGLLISAISFINQLTLLGQSINDIFFLISVVGSFSVTLIFLYLVINFTDNIINFLKLDSGFDDDKIVFENLNNQSLYKIAIVILGGFLMVDSFPRIIMDLVNEFKILASNNALFNHEANFYGEIIRVFNLVIGYVLITNASRIAKFLDKN